MVVTNSIADEFWRHQYIVAYTGPDNVTQGQEAGQLMVEALGGKGNVVMVNCLPGDAVAIKREAGFMEGIKGSDIKNSGCVDGSSSREKAQSLMENYLTRFGEEINGVYACDDNMGVGALNAIKAAGLAGRSRSPLVRFSASDTTRSRQVIIMVLSCSPRADDARLALKVAIMAAEGVEVKPLEYMVTPPISQLTIDNFERPVF